MEAAIEVLKKAVKDRTQQFEAAIAVLTKAVEDRAQQFNWTCTKISEKACWLEVGPHKLLLWPLPDQTEAAEKSIDVGKETAFDQWIVAGGAGVTNITMFCIAPLGSFSQSKWEVFAAKVERDDKVCRKLVWLPREGIDCANAFLDRTFLARPWDKALQQGPNELSVLAESLTVPTEWMKLMLDSELDGADLINALLEISN